MADGGGDRLPVNCGIEKHGNSYVLLYNVKKKVVEKEISWNWFQEGDGFVAKLEVKTETGDVRYHNSAPISADIHARLSVRKKYLDGEYFKVMLKAKPDVSDLHQFFDVAQ